jgi:hydroxyethylthiazole kinase
MSNDIKSKITLVRAKSPLVHNITNFVVMEQTADALLAVGASPVMAHAVEEAEEMTGISNSLVVNMGTLSSSWVEAMIKSTKKAKELNIPIVFDPVGSGATGYRTETAKTIAALKPTVIRGNASEILSLCSFLIPPEPGETGTKGVDSTISSHSIIEQAEQLAFQIGAVVVVSGEKDIITNGSKTHELSGGSVMMTRVTGMGCIATAVIGAFLGAGFDSLEASLYGMQTMAEAGEFVAHNSKGTGSFKINFMDYLYGM